MKFRAFILSACVSTLLMACGGGDSAPATTVAAVDKYIGSWYSACDSFNERTLITITKASDSVFNVKSVTTDFGAANCATTNNPLVVLTVAGTASISGMKTIGADTVDKINVATTVTQSTDPVNLLVGTALNYKDVIKFSTTQFQFGDTDSSATTDADGFPTRLDPAEIYIKQ